MQKVTRYYKTLEEAKKALQNVFGPGPYFSGGRSANARLTDGIIEREEDKRYSCTLSSPHFVAASLEAAFDIGIDNI